MEAQSSRSRIGGSPLEQLLASRRGSVALAAAAALLAGVLLYLFVSHYRQHSNAPTAVAPSEAYVFLASRYIPEGTPATTVASEGLLRRTAVPTSQAVAGAITDPSAITGEVSVASIAAGQQITVTDFTRTAVTLGSYLSGDQRAIAIPIDAAHGLTTYLAPGDHIDIMSDGGGGTTLIAQDVAVLANQGGNVVLRASDKLALVLAEQSDNDKLWFTLRAPLGSQSSIAVGSEAKS